MFRVRFILASWILVALIGCGDDGVVGEPVTGSDFCFPPGEACDGLSSERCWEASAELRKLDRVAAAGLACGAGANRELRVSLLDQASRTLTADSGRSECQPIIDFFDPSGRTPTSDNPVGCPGPLDPAHPQYQEVFDLVCGDDSVLDLSEVAAAASGSRLEPVHGRDLVHCGHSCESDLDCSFDQRFCVDGLCSAQGDEAPGGAYCQQTGGGVCAGLVDGDLGTSTPLFCTDSCGDENCTIEPSGFECSDESECREPAQCTPIEGSFGSQHCSQETTVTTSSLTWRDPSDAGSITLGMLMDNSGSLFGRGRSAEDQIVLLDRATDPDFFRIAAAKSLLLQLGSRDLAERLSVSVWSFRGETTDGVASLTGGVSTEPADLSSGGPLVQALEDLASGGDSGRSNVYQALEIVASEMGAAAPQGRRVVLLFTDGPDDSTTGDDRDVVRAAKQASLDSAVAAVTSAGVEVHIVHLDAGIGLEGLARSGPDYEDPTALPRDADGRTGPLEVYEDIACASGGVYWYVRAPAALRDILDSFGLQLGGYWTTQLEIPDLDAAVGPHFLSTGVSVETKVGGVESLDLGPLERQPSFGSVDTDDNRPIIFP